MGQRYQREIEEILDKVNEDQPAEGGRKRKAGPQQEQRPRRPNRNRAVSKLSLRISPGRLLVTGIVLLVAALVLSGMGAALAVPAAWIGIGLFVVAYILFFTRPRSNLEKRWRGQIIEDEPEVGPVRRLWRWISRG